MKKSVLSVFLLLTLAFAFIPHIKVYSQVGNRAKAHYVEGEILVKLKDDIEPFADREQIAQEIFPSRGVRSESLARTEKRNLRLIHMDTSLSVEEAVSRAASDPRVEYAEPNYLYQPTEMRPDDQNFNNQWGFYYNGCWECGIPMNIDATHAWEITTGSDDVVAAVIDSGIDFSHPDLAPNAWINPREIPDNGIDDDGNGYIDDLNGWNFANDNNKVYKSPEIDFHGTHVAGTLGAAGDNHIGVAGVAWHVKLMSLKFIGKKSGAGSSADAVKAIEYAIEQRKRGVNVRVINASWGGPGDSRALRDAIVKAGEAGILFVCAAGNEAADVDAVPAYPVGYSREIPSMISVAATYFGTLAVFSNYGLRTVTVGAPGQQVISTLPGGNYEFLSGTSMATPHVSGIAVLLWSHEPLLTPAEVRQRIIATAEPDGFLASKTVSAGHANAYNALINRVPVVAKPAIALLDVSKKKIVIDGLGFAKGSSVIEVNGVAVPETAYDDTYRLSNGTYTRVTANLGKQGIKNFFPAKIEVPVTVFNSATGQRSTPQYFKR